MVFLERKMGYAWKSESAFDFNCSFCFISSTVIPGHPIQIYVDSVNEEVFIELIYAERPDTMPPTLS
jgi:hypothetical protein